MAEERKYKPMIKWIKAYQNESRNGEMYFTAYIGDLKLVMLRDKNAKPGEAGWNLFWQERDPKPEGQGKPGQQAQGQGYGQQLQQNHHPPAQQYHQHQPTPGNGGFVDDLPF